MSDQLFHRYCIDSDSPVTTSVTQRHPQTDRVVRQQALLVFDSPRTASHLFIHPLRYDARYCREYVVSNTGFSFTKPEIEP